MEASQAEKLDDSDRYTWAFDAQRATTSCWFVFEDQEEIGSGSQAKSKVVEPQLEVWRNPSISRPDSHSRRHDGIQGLRIDPVGRELKL